MDPFLFLKYLAFVIKLGVRKIGWKPIIIGWVLCIPLIMILERVM